MPEEICMEVHNIVQEAVIKTISKEKKCKKAKQLSEEALQIDEKRRKSKKQGRKGKIYPTECRLSENSMRAVGSLQPRRGPYQNSTVLAPQFQTSNLWNSEK